jgi:hypothetical protein
VSCAPARGQRARMSSFTAAAGRTAPLGRGVGDMRQAYGPPPP